MIRRLALLAVLLVAAACTPGTSPSDGLETTPPLTSPDASLETTMPSTDLPTEVPSESPITSP